MVENQSESATILLLLAFRLLEDMFEVWRHFSSLDLLGAYYADNVNDGLRGNTPSCDGMGPQNNRHVGDGMTAVSPTDLFYANEEQQQFLLSEDLTALSLFCTELAMHGTEGAERPRAQAASFGMLRQFMREGREGRMG
eukprot:754191-Hanusia_phi.AAC.20